MTGGLDFMRKGRLLGAVLLMTGCAVTATLAQDCTPTPRMSYEQSHAIKRSMLPPGHTLAEYELDHTVPLCLGGSNDRSNLQLQTWGDAKRKDLDEAAVCQMVREGVLTCQEAQQTMREWVSGDEK
jgi:hypothetical protein